MCMLYQFLSLSLPMKIRLHKNFSSEIFYWQKYPNLRYLRLECQYTISRLYAAVQHTFVGDLHLPMPNQFVRMGRKHVDSYI